MKILEIILPAIIVILGIILTYKWKKLSTFQKIILSIFILLTIALTIVQIKNSQYAKAKEEYIEKINSKFGELYFDGETETIIVVGNKDERFIINSPDGTPFVNKKHDPVIRMNIKDGKLLVYILIRDLNGEVIAVIDGDTWTVFDDDYEYNDDNGKAFELVTKGERKVFFQIEYKNELVHVSGYMLNPDGSGVVIYYNEKGHLIANIADNASKINKIKNINISRLFKYPRSKHYGERL